MTLSTTPLSASRAAGMPLRRTTQNGKDSLKTNDRHKIIATATNGTNYEYEYANGAPRRAASLSRRCRNGGSGCTFSPPNCSPMPRGRCRCRFEWRFRLRVLRVRLLELRRNMIAIVEKSSPDNIVDSEISSCRCLETESMRDLFVCLHNYRLYLFRH